MKNLFFKTAFLLFAFTFSNCENNDPQDRLPPITQTGANTFGAIVDGQAFVPKDATSYPPGPRPKGLYVYYDSFLPRYEFFTITARNYEDIYISLKRNLNKLIII